MKTDAKLSNQKKREKNPTQEMSEKKSGKIIHVK
jgi:hypothetical protein